MSLCHFPLAMVCVILFIERTSVTDEITTSDIEEEATPKWKKPPLKFCAVAITTRRTTCTGTLILPKWFLTSYKCLDKRVIRYTVVGKLEDHSTYISSVVQKERCTDGTTDLILGRLKHAVPQYSPILPMATRMDVFNKPKCEIYVAVKSEMVVAHPANLTPMQDCTLGYYYRGRLACANILQSACFGPIGSSLVCSGRLLGIRFDEEDCSSRHVFANVAYIDYLILKKLSESEDGILADDYSGRRRRRHRNKASELFQSIDSNLCVGLSFLAMYFI